MLKKIQTITILPILVLVSLSLVNHVSKIEQNYPTISGSTLLYMPILEKESIDEIKNLINIFAYDSIDGNITNKIIIKEDTYSPATKIGTYQIVFSITNTSNKSSELFLTIECFSLRTATFHGPEILLFNTDQMHEIQHVHNSYTVTDDLNNRLELTHSTNFNGKVGEHYLYLSTTHPDGSTFTKDIPIIITDNQEPTIIVKKELKLSYKDITPEKVLDLFLFVDDSGTDLQTGVRLPSNITIGIIKVQVTATDRNMNFTMKTFDILIYDDIPPVITADTLIVDIRDVDLINPMANITAHDEIDGDVSNKIILISSDIQQAFGHYSMVYQVEDKNGNSTTYIRDVFVTEFGSPIIMFDKDEFTCSYKVFENAQTIIDYFKIFDDYDSEVFVSIYGYTYKDIGVYEITLIASDTANNNTTRTFIVNVIDDVKPTVIISDMSATDQNYENIDLYSAIQILDEIDLNPIITILEDNSSAVPGEYTIKYQASDYYGNTIEFEGKLTIIDTIPPTTDLTGLICTYQEFYNEQSLNALLKITDNSFGLVLIAYTYELDTIIGQTVLYITTTDESNNISEHQISVTITDNTVPEVSSAPIYINESDVFTHNLFEGITIYDEIDSNPTISIINNQLTDSEGIYIIEYLISDASNNALTLQREVHVNPTPISNVYKLEYLVSNYNASLETVIDSFVQDNQIQIKYIKIIDENYTYKTSNAYNHYNIEIEITDSSYIKNQYIIKIVSTAKFEPTKKNTKNALLEFILNIVNNILKFLQTIYKYTVGLLSK